MRRMMLLTLALSTAAIVLGEPGDRATEKPRGWDQTGRRDPFRTPMTPLPSPGAKAPADADKTAGEESAGPAATASKLAPPVPSATVCCYEPREFQIDLGIAFFGCRMSSSLSLDLPVSESVALFGETWCSAGDPVPGRPDLVIQEVQDGRVLTRNRN